MAALTRCVVLVGKYSRLIWVVWRGIAGAAAWLSMARSRRSLM